MLVLVLVLVLVLSWALIASATWRDCFASKPRIHVARTCTLQYRLLRVHYVWW